jgi:hypothetical protein
MQTRGGETVADAAQRAASQALLHVLRCCRIIPPCSIMHVQPSKHNSSAGILYQPAIAINELQKLLLCEL